MVGRNAETRLVGEHVAQRGGDTTDQFVHRMPFVHCYRPSASMVGPKGRVTSGRSCTRGTYPQALSDVEAALPVPDERSSLLDFRACCLQRQSDGGGTSSQQVHSQL